MPYVKAVVCGNIVIYGQFIAIGIPTTTVTESAGQKFTETVKYDMIRGNMPLCWYVIVCVCM